MSLSNIFQRQVHLPQYFAASLTRIFHQNLEDNISRWILDQYPPFHLSLSSQCRGGSRNHRLHAAEHHMINILKVIHICMFVECLDIKYSSLHENISYIAQP